METYIFGHKNPDTDSICSAIAYADFKNKTEEGEYVPARLGGINNETKFVLDKFGVSAPELIESGTDKQMILVDHNQKSQTINNIEKGDILEILDHHNINFSSDKTINFCTEKVGATATIIAEKYFKTGTEMSDKIAGILLGAIVSDCVIFKSPVTTERDKEAAGKLAKKLQITDLTAFGMDIFKVKSVWNDMTAGDIIEMDRKEYDMSGTKVSISQVETVDHTDLIPRKKELLSEMSSLNVSKGFRVTILLITDIIKEGCLLLAVGDVEKVEKAFDKKLEAKSMWLDGVLSRKEQIIPPLEDVFK